MEIRIPIGRTQGKGFQQRIKNLITLKRTYF